MDLTNTFWLHAFTKEKKKKIHEFGSIGKTAHKISLIMSKRPQALCRPDRAGSQYFCLGLFSSGSNCL